MAKFRDTVTFEKAVTFNGPVDFSDATSLVTPDSSQFIERAELPFVLANVTAGSTSFSDLPSRITILSTHVETTTSPSFSNGSTTGLTVKVGTGLDDDGFMVAASIVGSPGFFAGAKGVLQGTPTTGETENVGVTFTPTGGAPSLAHVSACAGKIVILYVANLP